MHFLPLQFLTDHCLSGSPCGLHTLVADDHTQCSFPSPPRARPAPAPRVRTPPADAQRFQRSAQSQSPDRHLMGDSSRGHGSLCGSLVPSGNGHHGILVNLPVSPRPTQATLQCGRSERGLGRVACGFPKPQSRGLVRRAARPLPTHPVSPSAVTALSGLPSSGEAGGLLIPRSGHSRRPHSCLAATGVRPVTHVAPCGTRIPSALVQSYGTEAWEAGTSPLSPLLCM